MSDQTLSALWAYAIKDTPIENLPDDEIEKYRLFYYSGAYAMINRNYILQTTCETKEDYMAAMEALQQECIDIHQESIEGKPEGKPFLKLV